MSTRARGARRDQDGGREALIERVIEGLRATSTAGVLLHSAISSRLGLSAADAKTYELLARLGPLTAGDIARHTGLATASVTSLVDRLEAKGFVARKRDPADRRRVIVEATGARDAELAPLYAPLAASSRELVSSYDDAQLATIADFLERSSAWAHEYVDRLRKER